MRRNKIGVEAMDLMLDIVVEPDLSWRWKDREEFEEIVRRGIFDPELGEQIHETASSVVDDIEHRRAPFCDPWPSWTPDRSWALPQLPAGCTRCTWNSAEPDVVERQAGRVVLLNDDDAILMVEVVPASAAPF